MYNSSTTKYLALLLSLLLIASAGGVFAVWIYAEAPAATRSSLLSVAIPEENFVWTPEQILPDDEDLGKDYLNLLVSLTDNSKMGLNSGKGNVIEDTAKKYGYVHCDQNVTGGNLKHLKDFFTSADRELDFVVGYGDESTLYIYMFENYHISNGLVGVSLIPVYKTIVVKETVDGEEIWTAKESQLGYATVKYMPNSNHIGIHPEDWKRGSIPAAS